jgi:hypothetical protein
MKMTFFAYPSVLIHELGHEFQLLFDSSIYPAIQLKINKKFKNLQFLNKNTLLTSNKSITSCLNLS